MATVTSNIAANFAGRAWMILMGVAFVPVYIGFLGIEAYGLIGFFLTLQSVFGIMDLGLSLTLNRELACASESDDDDRRVASMVRTVEIFYWTISLVVGLLVVASAHWIATSWVNAVSLPATTIENAVRMMGIIIALQAPFALYQGGLTGLNRQVSVNLILAAGATLRAGGAALVLWLVAPTVEAYFEWQLVAAGMTTIICGWTLWKFISGGSRGAKFDLSILRNVWRYSLAVSATAILGIGLTQLDKLILSKLLSLELLGYYTLASLVASCLWGIILPLNTALFPDFARLHAQDKELELASLYHKGCQLLAAILIPTVLVISSFSYELLLAWTGNERIAANSYLLVILLVIGTGLNGLASIPSSLQSAAGWPSLVLRTNIVLVLLVVPILFLVVPRFGAIGAAGVWIATNAAYVCCTTPVMHTRLLVGEFGRWLLGDVAVPLAVASAVIFFGTLLKPAHASGIAQLPLAFFLWCLAVLLSAASMPLTRVRLRMGLTRFFALGRPLP